MLSNLFIDTDIILDIVLEREEFFENSSKIFQLYEEGELLLFTSPTIIINAQYIGQRLIAKEKCRSNIKDFKAGGNNLPVMTPSQYLKLLK